MRRVGASKGLALLMGGTLLGQVVIIGAAPVLSRLYSPEDFALLAVFTSMVSIGTVAAAFRLEMAVPLEESDASARSVVSTGLVFACMFGLLFTVGAIPAASWVANATDITALEHWFWLVPFTCSFSAAFMLLNQYAVRRGAFGSIATRTGLRSLVMTGVQLGGGAARWAPGGLIVGFIAGHLISAIALWTSAGLRSGELINGIRYAPKVLQERWKFATKLTIAGLFNIAGTQLPVIIFAIGYSAAETGALGMTQRAIALPVALIGTTVAQVYLSTLSRSRREDVPLYPIFLKATVRLAAVSVVGVVTLLVFGPTLFGLIFGDQWTLSGRFAQALAVGIGFQLVASPLSQTLIVLGRTTLQLSWDIGRFFIACGAVSGAALLGTQALTAVWLWGGAMAITYLVQWTMCLKIVHPHRT